MYVYADVESLLLLLAVQRDVLIRAHELECEMCLRCMLALFSKGRIMSDRKVEGSGAQGATTLHEWKQADIVDVNLNLTAESHIGVDQHPSVWSRHHYQWLIIVNENSTRSSSKIRLIYVSGGRKERDQHAGRNKSTWWKRSLRSSGHQLRRIIMAEILRDDVRAIARLTVHRSLHETRP